MNAWLLHLKDNNIEIEFPEFVGQYSSLFAGSDPGSSIWKNLVLMILSDIPAGEGTREKSGKNNETKEEQEQWKVAKNEDDSDDEWRLSSKFVRPGSIREFPSLL